MDFKDRKRELNEFRDIIDSKKFELIILYGRRRVGKTELILQATRDKKRLYYLAVGQDNLRRFYNTCSQHYPEVNKLREDYEVLFNFLKEKTDIIILDEFQNMILEDENILHLLQSIIDTQLKNTTVKLFLVGSSISMMTSKILTYTSPLYGRRTGSIKLEPINFYDFTQFFPTLSLKKQIEVFSFCDGIPYYINMVDPPFWKWLENELKKTSSVFKDEIDFLMRYEFSRPGTYKAILEAIAFGKTKLNEIKMYIGSKRTDISPYLSNLIDVDMIIRGIPITEKETSRKGRYYLKDNFLKFWFRFVYPNLSSIEEGIFNADLIKQDYPVYLGKIFESVIKDFLIQSRVIEFTKIGKWWWKEYEIDLIAMNQMNNTITFIECKWQKEVNASRILHDLMEKKKYVDWNLKERKESFMLFARSFYSKPSEYKGIPVKCYDLKDISELIKTS